MYFCYHTITFVVTNNSSKNYSLETFAYALAYVQSVYLNNLCTTMNMQLVNGAVVHLWSKKSGYTLMIDNQGKVTAKGHNGDSGKY